MDVREAEALVDGAPATAGSLSESWRSSLLVLSLSLVGTLLVYFDTFRSIAAIWSRSDTYVHGYFILPISMYLIWTRREEVRGLVPRPEARAIAAVALTGVGWLAARLAGVLVVEQYCAVASIPLVAWAVLGPTVCRRLLFPLAYLLLAVPVGEALIPNMIDYTAAFAVAALRFTGVPVLQEGNLLTLPNSQWSVVEACSGLRYLIACITIGLVYAYLTYRSWVRRALFVGLSIVVPIVANWVRAYLIVFVGYKSDMRLAVGVDHLIYGWVFYAAVMVLLLWVGSLFADEPTPERLNDAEKVPGTRPSVGSTVMVACAAILAAAVWPVWAVYADSSSDVSANVSFEFPEKLGEWSRGGEALGWEPAYVGAVFQGGSTYAVRDESVALHVALYANQRQGAELVTSANELVGTGAPGWSQVGRRTRAVSISGRSLRVEEGILDRGESQLVVWKWYWVSGRHTGSPIWAKVIESGEKLLLRRPWAAGIVVFAEDDDEDSARARLEEFLADGVETLDASLRGTSR
jgi:exosortase A